MNTTIRTLAALSLSAFAGTSLFAISGEISPITGSAVIDGDTHISFIPQDFYNNIWGINADSGAVVSSVGTPTVTIDMTASDSTAVWGLWAHDGGSIQLDGSVIVNGKDNASTGVLVYDALSSISVGAGSKLYAGKNGAAVGNLGGNVTVGDNSYLWGNVWGGEDGAVYAKRGGTITLGNNVTAINDATGNEFQYLHFALASMTGSTINVGNDATISLIGTESYNSGAIRASGNVNIGDRATITAEGRSYGIYADTAGIEVVVGEKAKISTGGAAVVATGGSSVSLDVDAEITTTGTGAHGVAVQSKSQFTAKDGLSIDVSGEDSIGVSATSGGKAELQSSTIVSNTYAVYAASNDSEAVSIITAVGVQNITGDIQAAANGNIDITYADGSYFKGAASVEEDGILDFDMTGTNWVMTGSSSVSDITISASSTLQMTISEDGSFTGLTADSFIISESTIKLILEDYIPSFGDEFQLVIADTYSITDLTFEFIGTNLADGLFWDISKFATTGTISVGRQIPEPAACAALFGGLVLALAVYRRKK